jgi:abhydrolase domain-containing protein 1/3
LIVALEQIKTKYPKAQIVATGVSLGGIVLSRYLIESGEQSLVDTAILISVAWDFAMGSDSMERTGLNMALNQHLVKALVAIVEENKEVLEPVKHINYQEVIQSKTLREFDERFTAKMWGYKSCKEYYYDASNKGKLNRIKVPALIITAADDMFAPLETLPIEEISEVKNIAMVVTQRGGHIGFMEGLLPVLPFYSERLAHQFFESLAKLRDFRRDLC